MKLLKLSIRALAVIILAVTIISCAENKKSEKAVQESEIKNNDGHDHENMAEESEIKHDSEDTSHKEMTNMGEKTSKSTMIIDGYLLVKNSLVADDNNKAAETSKVLLEALQSFDTSGFSADEQKELAEIIEDAIEHAEHIIKSPIDHQREHFEVLSKDVVDLIAIVGSDRKLYQDYCPMYNKGSIWLSEFKDIKNPFYGSKMLTCGSVQNEI